MFKKIAIVGVGAIGGLFAGWLGSRLPAGQDWITQKGYLRESRGGRHIGGNQHHFGSGARQSHLLELRAEGKVSQNINIATECSCKVNSLKYNRALQ